MQRYKSPICRWIFNTPHRGLNKAYRASKQVRNIQRDYLSYKNTLGISSKRAWYKVALYVDAVLNYSASQIYWGLLEFKVSRYFLSIFTIFEKKQFHHLNELNNLRIDTNLVYTDSQNNIDTWSFIKHLLFPSNSNEIYFNQINSKYYDKINIGTCSNDKHIIRKLVWIETALRDLEILKKQSWIYDNWTVKYPSDIQNVSLNTISVVSKNKDISYESVGLVPRSITRTLSRFQTELAGRSASLVLPEFRLAKYQAVASLQYMAYLIICPWLLSFLFQLFFLEPVVANWWNTTQSEVFFSFSQEEKALKRLQEVEELLWLDIIMNDSSVKQPQDLSAEIHNKTIDLVNTYNQESIHTISHLFTDFISLSVLVYLFIFGKKRLTILNSWVQEVFYSLSDTMKAFFILLLTDLCIGFHSPHGWEILIGFILEHLGFSHNKHVISCFVSTFPVILDTVFKYWIFRHLNRISPSIVVSYHTMNE
uniref:Potassium/proton antiporter CemA n=2 Tax=Roya TaxID=43942 RepID=A0A024B4S8_9VIRI|nr:chloroplast envelope membrane protein [Roya anglica]YP_009256867.1 chloroplast enveloppe membrane protein [Roya obtusa]AHZ11088.1 chloroplast envelope membrane protein [Roya anglica]ANI25917.1 chloroplast enveloppe membrane protein [Roya obtusa]